jgi:hypothetical protein
MPRSSDLGVAKVCVFQGSTALARSNVDLSPTTGLGQRKAVFARNGLVPTKTHRLEVSRSSGRIELDGVTALK